MGCDGSCFMPWVVAVLGGVGTFGQAEWNVLHVCVAVAACLAACLSVDVRTVMPKLSLCFFHDLSPCGLYRVCMLM